MTIVAFLVIGVLVAVYIESKQCEHCGRYGHTRWLYDACPYCGRDRVKWPPA